MQFICPNPECQKTYQLSAEQIPQGKRGFQCAACGTLIEIEQHTQAAAQLASVKPGGLFSKPVTWVLTLLVLIMFFSFGYFYFEYRTLISEELVSAQVRHGLSQERQQELKKQLEKPH